MSALIVEVPDAEPIVGEHRQRWDSSAALGVPAHVTVLFPFMHPSDIDNSVCEELADVFAAHRQFDVCFRRSDWFSDSVLWLAPDPPDNLRALTTAVVEAFPGYPPYGGEFDEVVPHLTVADRGDLRTLRGVEESVGEGLPLHCHAREVSLYCGTSEPGSWFRATTLSLA
jgi:2'-5' RNA ligase